MRLVFSGLCISGLPFLGRNDLRYGYSCFICMLYGIALAKTYTGLHHRKNRHLNLPLLHSTYIQALKKFKEEHGHLKIPRSHPYFGNWPNWQRTQYRLYLKNKESSKLNQDKVDKLHSIGFFKRHEVNAMHAREVEENL